MVQYVSRIVIALLLRTVHQDVKHGSMRVTEHHMQAYATLLVAYLDGWSNFILLVFQWSCVTLSYDPP